VNIDVPPNRIVSAMARTTTRAAYFSVPELSAMLTVRSRILNAGFVLSRVYLALAMCHSSIICIVFAVVCFLPAGCPHAVR
jgi:hypothetical protein